jgi:hypothetical protein
MSQPPSVTYRTPSERQRIIESRPLARVRRFASLLNWHGLQLETFTIESDELDELGQPVPLVWTDYITPDRKFNLQIHQQEVNSPTKLRACVVCDRYRVYPREQHSFELFDDDRLLAAEAERLRPLLDRRLYRSRAWRKELLRRQPERWGRSRKRNRGGIKF